MSKGKDNSDEYSLFNDANIKNSLNNNFQNEKHISFGDIGVPETYVPNAKDKKSKEKKNSSNEKIPQNFKKGKIIIIKNEIHINNNSNNNNIKPSNNNEINSGNIENNTKKVKIPNLFYIPKNINKINNININLKNNQINQIPYPLPKPDELNIGEDPIFSNYQKPPLSYLGNLDNTSYLNSVLLLIFNIKPFANYLLSLKNINNFYQNANLFPLLFAIYDLCTKLYYLVPINIGEIFSLRNIFGNYNIIYKDYYCEKNPNEFIVFFLDKLKDELGLINNNYYDNFIYNYFTWIKMKEMKCNECLKLFHDWENFQTFDLNVVDVFKYKKLEKIKIKNCIDFYNIPTNKKSYCNFCKKYQRITTKNKIYFFPKVFIFLLDLNKNKNINFIIEQKINLDEFKENKTVPLIYKLNGVVFFDTNKNKYNVICVSPFDKKWYLYDDEKVEVLKFGDFVRSCGGYKNYRPCILLYNQNNDN